MRAGGLDKRVTIQRRVMVRTQSGATENQFEDWLKVWAAIEPLTPREVWGAQQVQSDITAQIRMRYRPGIDATMRIKYVRGLGGSPDVTELYDIEGPPVNSNTEDRELVLSCKLRDAEGFRTGET